MDQENSTAAPGATGSQLKFTAILKQMINDGSLTVSSGISIDVDEGSVMFVTRLEHGGSAIATDCDPHRLIVGYVAAVAALSSEVGKQHSVKLLDAYLKRMQEVVADLEVEVAKLTIAIKTQPNQPVFGKLN